MIKNSYSFVVFGCVATGQNVFWLRKSPPLEGQSKVGFLAWSGKAQPREGSSESLGLTPQKRHPKTKTRGNDAIS